MCQRISACALCVIVLVGLAVALGLSAPLVNEHNSKDKGADEHQTCDVLVEEIRALRAELVDVHHELRDVRAELDEHNQQRGDEQHDDNPLQHDANNPDRHTLVEGAALLDQMLTLRALGEELESPDLAVLMGIQRARHFDPERRIDVYTAVLRDIERPALLRNAAYLAMIETTDELERPDDTAELLKRLISENARRWRD